MKYGYNYLLFIYIIYVFLNPTFIFCYGWHFAAIEDTNGTNCTSLKLDSNDYPHISYSSSPPYKDIKYAYYDGERWNIEVIEHYNMYGGGALLCLNSNDNPHIIYSIGDEDAIKYACYDGKKWIKEIVYVNEDCGATSIALDSNERPHVTIVDYKNTSLIYAYFDGNKWNIETVDYKGNVGQYSSLAIDSKDSPHISYSDESSYNLKYAYFDGTKWNIETVDDDNYVGRFTSIAIDSKDRPHISYLGNDGLRYAYWNGRSWVIKVVDNEYGAGGFTSLALDSQDRPHISYRVDKEWPNPDILRYAYYDGYKWHIINVDSYEYCSVFTSLALDSNEYPHISYYKGVEIYYAYFEGPYPGIDLTSFTAKPNNDTITLNWSVSTDEDISGFNLYRRFSTPTGVSPVREIAQSPLQSGENYVWTKVNTSLITGTNPYSYTDRNVMPETSYEYKLEAVTNDTSEMLGTTECTSEKGTPESFDITSIYPCPASDRIRIDVVIPEQADIDISIYDITGRKVATVASGLYNSGEYTLTSDVSGLKNGVYILRMNSDGFSASKNFTVAR
jgi:hypothetical protein